MSSPRSTKRGSFTGPLGTPTHDGPSLGPEGSGPWLSFRHWVDSCTQHRLSGWTTAPTITVAVNDGPIARLTPSTPRPDLIEAGIGPGHGFDLFFPGPLWPDDEISIHGPDGSVLRRRMDEGVAGRIAELTRHFDPARQVGLEIGPLDRPLIPKSRFRVSYLDQAPKSDLAPRYTGHGVHIPALIDPDFACGSRDFVDVVGDLRFDYCVASHVIEHVPDMIGWLWQIHAVLKDRGVLALAIPHAEKTFDAKRNLTTFAELTEAYFGKFTQPNARQIMDDIQGSAAYHGTDALEAAFRGFHLANHARKVGLYCDTHCTVFTPHSFRDILLCLDRCELLGFQLLSMGYRGDDEFTAHLVKCATKTLPDHIKP